MMKFPADIIGRPLVDAYSPVEAQGVSRLNTLKGRPRYELKDTQASHATQVTLQTDRAGFAAFQTFWASINYGVDWFLMDLTLDVLGTGSFEVHATGPFQTVTEAAQHIKITIPLEIRS